MACQEGDTGSSATLKILSVVRRTDVEVDVVVEEEEEVCQKLIQLSFAKIVNSKSERGGAKLHKNLLIFHLLQRARDGQFRRSRESSPPSEAEPSNGAVAASAPLSCLSKSADQEQAEKEQSASCPEQPESSSSSAEEESTSEEDDEPKAKRSPTRKRRRSSSSSGTPTVASQQQSNCSSTTTTTNNCKRTRTNVAGLISIFNSGLAGICSSTTSDSQQEQQDETGKRDKSEQQSHFPPHCPTQTLVHMVCT